MGQAVWAIDDEGEGVPKNKCMSFGAFRSVLPLLYGQKLSATPGSRAKLGDVSVFNGICG